MTPQLVLLLISCQSINPNVKYRKTPIKATTAEQKLVIAASLAPAYIEPVVDELGLSPENIKDAYYSIGWSMYYIGKFDDAELKYW